MAKIADNLFKFVLDFQFTWNVERVKNLVRLYDSLGRGRGRNPVDSADILRSAIVLLHASFEELLREVAQHKWPYAEEAVLDDIPLIGINQTGRPEKFFLGRHAPYRDKSVDYVITESVKEYLGQFTVNNTTDLSRFLNSVGIPLEPVRHLFPTLEQMMSRRHYIVHNADRNPTTDRGEHTAQSIARARVLDWVKTVEQFCHIIQRVPWKGEA